MAFTRKSSLRSSFLLTQLQKVFIGKTKQKQKQLIITRLIQKKALWENALKPFVANANLCLKCTDSLTVLTRKSIQILNQEKIRVTELQSEDILEELFNLLSMKPGRGVEEDHSDYPQLDFLCVCGSLCGCANQAFVLHSH